MHAIRLALTAALLLPTAPVPQQPVAPTIKVDTKLTVIDVTVTDKNGRPVHGLTQADFTVKEDGKLQPIRNFDEYGTTIPSAQIAPQLPPGLYTNQPKPAATTTATNIILLDNVETAINPLRQPELLIYGKLQAEKYLKSLPAGTKVAVLKSEDGLRMIQDVTEDRDVLQASIEKVAYKEITGATLVPHPRIMIEEACAVWNNQSRLTLNTLRQLAGYASGIPGRKNVLWLMPGIPLLTNYSHFHTIPCLGDYTDEYKETLGLLVAAHVALYPLDTHGLSGEPGAASFFTQANYHESMRDLAEATGGIAYFNRNDLDTAMTEAVATGSDYYAVSYSPPLAGYDGKFHSIDIKLNKPGLQLQYRKGYTSLDVAKLNSAIKPHPSAAANLPTAISQFRAGMAHGAAPSSELLLATSIKPVSTPSQPAPLPIKGDLNPKVKAEPLVRYNIIYSLPAGQLALANNPDGTHKASVEFDIIAYGEDGTKLSVIRQTASVSLSAKQAEDFQKKPFEVPLQLDLPPGKLFVRVGALDVTSGKAGTLEVPQTVAKP